MCIYMYIYKHPADTQFPLSFPFYVFPFSLRGWCSLSRAGAHTRRGS